MEPADLNSPANEDPRLEAMLRSAAPNLPDDGFSTRVLAALPQAVEQRVSWRRALFCVVGAGVGVSLALWQGVSWPELQSGIERFATTLANAGPSLANPMFAAALVVTLLSLLVAFQSELREKLLE